MTDNPKAAMAASLRRTQFHTVPLELLRAIAHVMQSGAAKYGRFNFKTSSINATTYVDSALGHFIDWASGQDYDKDTGEHLLAHVIANCLVVLSAIRSDTFIDDREWTEVLDAPRSMTPMQGVQCQNLPRTMSDELRKVMDDVPSEFYEGDMGDIETRVAAQSLTKGAQHFNEMYGARGLINSVGFFTEKQVDSLLSEFVSDVTKRRALMRENVLTNLKPGWYTFFTIETHDEFSETHDGPFDTEDAAREWATHNLDFSRGTVSMIHKEENQ